MFQKLASDFHKFLPAEAMFGAKLSVEPRFRDALPHDFLVKNDFIASVMAYGHLESDATSRSPCRVFVRFAHAGLRL